MLCSLLFSLYCLLSNLSIVLSILTLSTPLLAWDSERKVALELCVWSQVELICWDRLQWEKIVYASFHFLPCFFFFFWNPGHFSREMWLPSLFCFFFLESRKWQKNIKNVAVTVFFFFSIKTKDVADCTAMCPSVWRTARCALVNGFKIKVPMFTQQPKGRS